jgi:excisionase family DNA binding protein
MIQSNKENPEAILTTTEAARLLGVATSTVQLWMESGTIDSWKTPGGHRRTRLSSIRALMDGTAPQELASPGNALIRPAAKTADPEFIAAAKAGYPLPGNETERLAALQALRLVDSDPEARFDRIARLAALVTDCPIALVSLLTSTRQWFKARVGLAAQETPREWAFCAHAILQEGTFVVEDTARDDRFRHNPLVLGDPQIRFYAGFPLRDPAGLPMGTLCVIDREPRRLRAAELQALEDLAAIAAQELTLK